MTAADTTLTQAVDDGAAGTGAGPWRIAARRLRRKKLAVAALIVIGLFYLVGLFAPVLAPHDYRDQDLENTLAGPSMEHPLGTDRLGRDLLSRTIMSTRTTVVITMATVFTGGLVLAVGLGMLSGYVGGATDTAIMRSGEVVASLPGLPMLILLTATMSARVNSSVEWAENRTSTDALEAGFRSQSGSEFGLLLAIGVAAAISIGCAAVWLSSTDRRSVWWLVPGFLTATIILVLFGLQAIYALPGSADYFLVFGVLSLFSWVGGARLVRSQVLSLRQTEYVIAARAMGGSTGRILWSHILPNVMPIVIVGLSASLAVIATSEIALTFFGVGIQEPSASFGQLIFEGAGLRALQAHIHLLLGPAIVVGLLMFAFNFLGDALNDVLTPRAR
jgi:ABC-type dipeptide/oligopeptide/nickel transport system permease subunit